MNNIAKLEGWFQPASVILDRFLQLKDIATELKQKMPFSYPIIQRKALRDAPCYPKKVILFMTKKIIN